MYYKDIPEYYNKTQLNNIFNPQDKKVSDGDIFINSEEGYSKFYDSVYNSLDNVLPSENDDYIKTIQEVYETKDLSKQKVNLTFLTGKDAETKLELSKGMRKIYKQVNARQMVADSHTYSTASDLGLELNHKFLASFENNGLSDHVESSDTQTMKNSVSFLKDESISQAERLDFLKKHINKISEYKDTLLKKGNDQDFATNFKSNYYKSSALEGLSYIPDLAKKFNITLDDATKRKCEYLGKLGKSSKEVLNANAQRISDVAYGMLEESSAKQFSNAFNTVKDASDEIDSNKNTYYSTALEDCKKANYDLMKAFIKESVAELNIDPETTFMDANGNIAKIDDLEKINPNLDPTVVFDAEGNLKTFVDFNDLSGKPTTYENVKTYDLKDNAKVKEACEQFKSDLESNKLFKDAKDEDLKAIKDNLSLLTGKDAKVNTRELTEKTVALCNKYITKVKNDSKSSVESMEMATKMGEMYRSMCCSLAKQDLEKLIEKQKENLKTNEKENKKENLKTNEKENKKENEKTNEKENKKEWVDVNKIEGVTKNNIENEKMINRIFDELDEMPLFEDDDPNIDTDLTKQLQDDLAKDTQKINGTYTDEKDKDLSLSVEQQKEIKIKERESVNIENDDYSINSSESKDVGINK